VRERDSLSPTVCGAPMQLRPIRGAGSCDGLAVVSKNVVQEIRQGSLLERA